MRIQDIVVGACYANKDHTTVRRVVAIEERPWSDFPANPDKTGTTLGVVFTEWNRFGEAQQTHSSRNYITLDSFARWAALRTAGVLSFSRGRGFMDVSYAGVRLGRLSIENIGVPWQPRRSVWYGTLQCAYGLDVPVEGATPTKAQQACRDAIVAAISAGTFDVLALEETLAMRRGDFDEPAEETSNEETDALEQGDDVSSPAP